MGDAVRAGLRVLALAAALPAAAMPVLAESPASSSVAAPACIEGAGVRHVATGVVDAATLSLDDGSEVRLAGTLPPSRPLTAAASDRPWEPERAAAAALSARALGASIEVFAEARSRDRYGRLVAHVVILGRGERRWLQGELLRAGQARAYALSAGEPCLSEMIDHERVARVARRGLWSSAAYGVRNADRPGALWRLRSTFQIVEGRVAEVAAVRGGVYINFGRDWRTDFTAGVSWRKDSRKAFEGFDAKSLEGQRIRVRGWIDRRNGPFIELVHPAQIERVPADAPEPPAAESLSSRPLDEPGGGAGEPQAPTKSERPATRSPGAHEL